MPIRALFSAVAFLVLFAAPGAASAQTWNTEQ